jgi:hypothetical protein
MCGGGGGGGRDGVHHLITIPTIITVILSATDIPILFSLQALDQYTGMFLQSKTQAPQVPRLQAPQDLREMSLACLRG